MISSKEQYDRLQARKDREDVSADLEKAADVLEFQSATLRMWRHAIAEPSRPSWEDLAGELESFKTLYVAHADALIEALREKK